MVDIMCLSDSLIKERNKMKKAKLLLIVALSALTLQGCNAGNSISDMSKESEAKIWFEDTGIVVKNSWDRVYHIVKDGNGYLYYMVIGDSASLERVLDENGNSTKDISMFE